MMAPEAVTGAESVTLLRQYRPLFTSRPTWRYAFITGGRGWSVLDVAIATADALRSIRDRTDAVP